MFPGRHCTPDGHLVGTFEEIFNQPGAMVWKLFSEKKIPSNGQFQISLTKLRKLNKLVTPESRIPTII